MMVAIIAFVSLIGGLVTFISLTKTDANWFSKKGWVIATTILVIMTLGSAYCCFYVKEYWLKIVYALAFILWLLSMAQSAIWTSKAEK